MILEPGRKRQRKYDWFVVATWVILMTISGLASFTIMYLIAAHVFGCC